MKKTFYFYLKHFYTANAVYMSFLSLYEWMTNNSWFLDCSFIFLFACCSFDKYKLVGRKRRININSWHLSFSCSSWNFHTSEWRSFVHIFILNYGYNILLNMFSQDNKNIILSCTHNEVLQSSSHYNSIEKVWEALPRDVIINASLIIIIQV